MEIGQQQLGELINRLGVVHRPDAGERVDGAVVLLKVLDHDGNIGLRAVWSSDLNWLERVGMLREAEQAETRRNLGLDAEPDGY